MRHLVPHDHSVHVRLRARAPTRPKSDHTCVCPPIARHAVSSLRCCASSNPSRMQQRVLGLPQASQRGAQRPPAPPLEDISNDPSPGIFRSGTTGSGSRNGSAGFLCDCWTRRKLRHQSVVLHDRVEGPGAVLRGARRRGARPTRPEPRTAERGPEEKGETPESLCRAWGRFPRFQVTTLESGLFGMMPLSHSWKPAQGYFLLLYHVIWEFAHQTLEVLFQNLVWQMAYGP